MTQPAQAMTRRREVVDGEIADLIGGEKPMLKEHLAEPAITILSAGATSSYDSSETDWLRTQTYPRTPESGVASAGVAGAPTGLFTPERGGR